jgi:hypothetical protein
VSSSQLLRKNFNLKFSILSRKNLPLQIEQGKDKRGFDLISDALPFGRLWYTHVSHAVGYAHFYSRSHDAMIRVYDDAGNVIETHEHKRRFQRTVVIY